MKQLTLAVFLAACVIVPRAMAQRNELSGILGRTFVSDQGIQGAPAFDSQLRFGKGLTFEVNYARGVWGSPLLSLSAEVPVVVNVDQDLHAAIPIEIPAFSSDRRTRAARSAHSSSSGTVEMRSSKLRVPASVRAVRAPESSSNRVMAVVWSAPLSMARETRLAPGSAPLR